LSVDGRARRCPDVLFFADIGATYVMRSRGREWDVPTDGYRIRFGHATVAG
jgi:hypothetical protein